MTLREQALDAAVACWRSEHPPTPFIPGETWIRPSGTLFDESDTRAVADAALSMWFTASGKVHAFERALCGQCGVGHARLVNSGSSANLLALASFMEPEWGSIRLRPGDEVLTVAAGFPTTVNPIWQLGLVPVFVDIALPTYNMNVSVLESAIGPKTRAVMIAHALGNPFEANRIRQLCDERGLWLIEDACDALGAEVGGRPAGSWGDAATVSFYPAHQITSGEGGVVLTSRATAANIVSSLRDWGRHCQCDAGQDNVCGRRFEWQLGNLPVGYDHRYIFARLGYNLKATEIQGALGLSQLRRLPEFVAARQKNWTRLRAALDVVSDKFVLPEPLPDSTPSWFGFSLCIKPDAGFGRSELIEWLWNRKIDTRLFFGGNLLCHPAYTDKPRRVPFPLTVSEDVLRRAFWIGVHPALTSEMVNYMAESIVEFCKQ